MEMSVLFYVLLWVTEANLANKQAMNCVFQSAKWSFTIHFLSPVSRYPLLDQQHDDYEIHLKLATADCIEYTLPHGTPQRIQGCYFELWLWPPLQSVH